MNRLALFLGMLFALTLNFPAPAAGPGKGTVLPVVIGSVKSTEGAPLEAVVSVKRGKQKVKTDERGNFILMNVPSDAVLVVSFHKVKTEIAVDGREKIRLTLVDPIAQMKGGPAEQEVDTGLGKVRKSDYTGSLSELTAEDIERGGFTNLLDAMRAKIGAVTVTEDGQVTMRGINTFNGSIYALILLDGTEIDSLNDIDVKEVARVSVMKEGDMYGIKGANGVVLITSKQ